MLNQHTEISRRSPNLVSAEELAKTIGADLETVADWLEVGAIDRAVFGGGQFSKYELHRAALVFELVKFGLPPSCAKDVVREMEYDLQQIWARIPSSFKAYAIVIPTNRKWLVSWFWTRSTEAIDPLPMEDCIVLPVSDILARVTDETKRPGKQAAGKSTKQQGQVLNIAFPKPAETRIPDFHEEMNRFQNHIPTWVGHNLNRLRGKRGKWVRMLTGVALIVAWCFLPLPVVGIWMLPVGLALLAHDIPTVRTPIARLLHFTNGKIEKRKS